MRTQALLLLSSLSLWLGLVGPVPAAQAAKAIPAPPYYYVLDEPKVLSSDAAHALGALLVEHDHLTGEQVVIAIFNGLDGEDLNDYTNQVFSTWRIGKRGKDNGVLLALYWKDHRARIEVGYGLEEELTDARAKEILTDVLIPALQQSNPDRALSQTTLEILRTLGSPLIQSGKAEEILRNARMSEARPASPPMRNGWLVWLFLGIFFVILVLKSLLEAEAHFTSVGWYRTRPWMRRRWPGSGPGGWGGGFGGWGGGGGGGWTGGGGGGGFIGGGGSSGGGGASGSW